MRLFSHSTKKGDSTMSKTKKNKKREEEQYHKLWREYIDAVRSRKILIQK